MQADAEGLRSFTVIRAARDASVDGVSIAKGQLIALDAERRLLAQGAQLEAVMLAALERLGDFELVSCYHGEHVDDLSAALLREAIEAQGWAVDVEMVPGGQRHDLLLVAVE
jgi:dihydroxyacetone kinase-like predicted kinase